MDEIGKIIRQNLKSKNMSSTGLAEIIGLNPRTIDNVIHGKSRKASLLQRISVVLGINLSSYVSNCESTKSIEKEIDTGKYKIASNIVFSLIDTNQIWCSKVQLNQLISILYEYLYENPKVTTTQAKAFAEGAVKFGLSNFIISSKAVK